MDIGELRTKKQNLIRRARLFAALRSSFGAAGFLEVETDLLIPAPAPEEFIESIPAAGRFLRCSPELAMKIMLGAGFERIYQIGRCFRAGEHGRKHREEFTMLEYYAAGMAYRELAAFTAGFIRSAAQAIFGRPELSFGGETVRLDGEPEFITVEDAFLRFAGMPMAEASERDLFDELTVTRIEPELGRGRLTFLIDYPAERASLARLKPDAPQLAERWELYIGGIELANGYGELTDPAEQFARFEAARRFRSEQRMLDYPPAEDFFAALRAGLPPSSGCALGLDRLAMVFADASDIAAVRVE
jgi:lysyl-tRNA synthetase class 2